MKQAPPLLKPINPYLQRANELEKKSPIVSFYCRTYAAQLGISVIQASAKDEAATRYVIELMDRLEKDKATINPNNDEGRAVVELYALKMFKKADDADRSGRHDDIVAKLFYASSVLMEVTKQFGEFSDDIKEKQKYARWKAAEITRAIRTGTPVQSGPFKDPSSEQEMSSSHSAQQQQQAEHFPQNIKQEDNIPDPFAAMQQPPLPPPQNLPQAQTRDPWADFGMPNAQQHDFGMPNAQQHDFGMSLPRASNMNDFGMATPESQPVVSQNNDPFAEFGLSSQPTTLNSSSVSPVVPQPPPQVAPAPPPPMVTPKVQPTPSTTKSPTPQQQSPFSQAAPSKQPANQPMANKAQQQPITSKTKAPETLSVVKIVEAQKFAKYAVSALQFNDVKTARKNLEEALALLS